MHNCIAQKYSYGFFLSPAITSKTNDNILDEFGSGGILIRSTPSGKMSFGSNLTFQSGFAYRISTRQWHLQASLFYLQNSIKMRFENTSFSPTASVKSLNPEISVIKRFHFRNGIEIHWQAGISSGITILRSSGIYNTSGFSYSSNDSLTYNWSMNFNELTNKPKFSLQTSVNLSVPLSKSWNFEIGFGIIRELNKPNQWRYTEKTTHTNPNYFNSDFSLLTRAVNEGFIFTRFGAFKELDFTTKKRNKF